MSMMPRSKDILRRYTSFKSLLDIIQNKCLTLLDHSKWDDVNDKNCMTAYVRASGFNNCLALCFCNRLDIYHHWKIFAGGYDGVCIEFWKDRLTRAADKYGLRHGPMEYVPLRDIEKVTEKRKPDVSRLPFMKRTAFRFEKEYRFIYGSETDEVEKRVPISLDAIYSVIVNPWVDFPGYELIERKIMDLSGGRIPVSQSRMINHEKWLAFTKLY